MIPLSLEKIIIDKEAYPLKNQLKNFQPSIRLTIYPYSHPTN